jgi:hypothetical protein
MDPLKPAEGRHAMRFGQLLHDKSNIDGSKRAGLEQAVNRAASAWCADRDWNHQSREEALEGGGKPKQDKAVEPNFALSGKLAEESNTVNGVVMVYGEPPEARKPSLRWRLYTFKNGAPHF